MILVLAAVLLSGHPPQLDSGKIPAGPSDGPSADETGLYSPPDQTVTKCASFGTVMGRRMHLKMVRVRITLSPRWGSIWRADLKNHRDEKDAWRIVCAKNLINVRPLIMFDGTKSIQALP